MTFRILIYKYVLTSTMVALSTVAIAQVCKDIPPDVQKKIEEIRKNAEAGEVEAMADYANQLSTGIFMQGNRSEAFKWYKKAAEAGHVGSMYDLAVCFDLGQGTSKNEEQAFFWYKRAAQKENSRAMRALGDCYYYGGSAANKNLSEAFKWYHCCPRQGEL